MTKIMRDLFEHPHYAVVCCLVRTPQGVPGVSGAPTIAPAPPPADHRPLPPLGPMSSVDGCTVRGCSYSLVERQNHDKMLHIFIISKDSGSPVGAICVAHAPLLRIAAHAQLLRGGAVSITDMRLIAVGIAPPPCLVLQAARSSTCPDCSLCF